LWVFCLVLCMRLHKRVCMSRFALRAVPGWVGSARTHRMHLSGDLSASPLPFPHSRQVLFVAFLIVVVVIFRRRQQYRGQALQSLLAQGDGTDGAGPDMQALRGVVPVPAPRRPAIRHGSTEVAGSSTDTAERSGGEPAGGARAALPVRVESGREDGKRRSRHSSKGTVLAHACSPAAAVPRRLRVACLLPVQGLQVLPCSRQLHLQKEGQGRSLAYWTTRRGGHHSARLRTLFEKNSDQFA
jgi:hypothetical protein